MNQHVNTPIQIDPDLWQFTEANEMGPYVDAYLIVGEKKAALVDALQTDYGLYEEVRKITDLPVEVLLTHGHLDHAGAAIKEFKEAGCPIYLDLADLELTKASNPDADASWFTRLEAGMRFDLGGTVLEAIPCAGHTPGSYVFLDETGQRLFSGDSIGSGMFWMQIPGCLPMHEYLVNVSELCNRTNRLPDLKVYPGHRNQSPVQLTGQYVDDVKTISEGIVNGTMTGRDQVLDMFGMHIPYKEIAYGQMVSYCYNPDNL